MIERITAPSARKGFVPPKVGNSWASSPTIRRVMQGNRSRDTKPEIAVRRLLHARGHRYRIHLRPVDDLNRRADIVFTRSLLAVFVDGCFWHGCPKHFTPPATHKKYWLDKIATNRARDAETSRILRRRGWTVIRIWEHQAPLDAVKRVERALALAKTSQRSAG